MKIVLLPLSYLPVLGGLQSITHQLARELLAQQLSIEVVTRCQPPNLPQHEQIEEVPIERYPMYPRGGTISDPSVSRIIYRVHVLRTFFSLARAIRAARPDVVHIHYPYDETLLVHWLRRIHPFRLVVTLHGNELGKPGRPASTAYLHRLHSLLTAADAVTVCSASMLADLEKVIPVSETKTRVIANSVDSTRFTNQPGYRHPRPYIFSAGRLTTEKGFDLLLAAYARSVAKSVDLVIAGTGEDAQSLRTQAARLGVEGQVHWLGQANASDIASLLGGCRFVVIPSRAEAFGLIALEAMAAGKRVLATRVGGLPELVPEPPNRLVAPTVEGLAGGLQLMCNESTEGALLADTVNRKHADRFDVRQMAARYLATYCGE